MTGGVNLYGSHYRLRHRISRDVYVLDITVNFMLNKRKSKKAVWGFAPDPLAVTGGGKPLPQL